VGKREILIFLKRATICLSAGTVAGILLLMAVFALPTAPMQEHVGKFALEALEETDGNGFLAYLFDERESFTDAIIMQNATEEAEGKGIYERAMMIYRYDLEEDAWTPEESLAAVSGGTDTATMYLKEYSRYWHGYLVLVKPLLILFTWKQILVFLTVLQLVLLGIFLLLTVRKGKAQAGIAVLCSYLLMKPAVMAASVTMSVCWILTLCVLIYIAAKRDRLEEFSAYLTLFLITGMLTSYLDFLTYPIATLGVPLCVFFLLKEEGSMKKILEKLIGAVCGWGCGYIGLWGMKWVAADLTLHQGTIKDALWTVIGRTESVGGRPRMNGMIYTISLNLAEYAGSVRYFALGVAGAALVLVVIACFRTGVKETLVRQIPYAVVFLLPFLWIAAAQNHSALHARFTFRILAVSFLALAAVCVSCIRRIATSTVSMRDK
jgi:hypothetical protein